MLLRPSALLVVLLGASSAFAQKNANTFDLILNGKNFGKDTYTLDKSKSGYKLQSHIAAVTKGLQIDDRDTINYTDDYSYIDGNDSNQDSNAQTAWVPSKDKQTMTINNSGAGNVSSHVEPIAGSYPLINMPAFDAGAGQAALNFVLAHPSEAGYTLWLPGYLLSGMNARTGVTQQDNAVIPTDPLPLGPQSFNAQFAKGPDATGTLAGAPVKLHTYQLGFGTFRWTFYADEANTLMQMDVSTIHTSYVRSKFKLDAAAK